MRRSCQGTMSDELLKEQTIKNLTELNFMKKRSRRKSVSLANIDDKQAATNRECVHETAPLGTSLNLVKRNAKNLTALNSNTYDKEILNYQSGMNKMSKTHRYSDSENTPPEFQTRSNMRNQNFKQMGSSSSDQTPYSNERRSDFYGEHSSRTATTLEDGKFIPKSNLLQPNNSNEKRCQQRKIDTRNKTTTASTNVYGSLFVCDNVNSQQNDSTGLTSYRNNSFAQHSVTKNAADRHSSNCSYIDANNNNQTDSITTAGIYSEFTVEKSTLNPDVASFIPVNFTATTTNSVITLNTSAYQSTAQGTVSYMVAPYVFSTQQAGQYMVDASSGNSSIKPQSSDQSLVIPQVIGKQSGDKHTISCSINCSTVVEKIPKREKRRMQVGYSLNRRKLTDHRLKSANPVSGASAVIVNSKVNLDIDVMKTLNELDAMRLNSMRNTGYRIDDTATSTDSFSMKTVNSGAGEPVLTSALHQINDVSSPATKFPVNDNFYDDIGSEKLTILCPINAAVVAMNSLPVNHIPNNSPGLRMLTSTHQNANTTSSSNNLSTNNVSSGEEAQMPMEVAVHNETEKSFYPNVDEANVINVSNQEQGYIANQLEKGLQNTSPMWFTVSQHGNFYQPVIPTVEVLNENKTYGHLTQTKVSQQKNSCPNIPPTITQSHSSFSTSVDTQYTETNSYLLHREVSNICKQKQLASPAAPPSPSYMQSQVSYKNTANGVFDPKETRGKIWNSITYSLPTNQPPEPIYNQLSHKSEILQESVRDAVSLLRLSAECTKRTHSPQVEAAPVEVTESQICLNDKLPAACFEKLNLGSVKLSSSNSSMSEMKYQTPVLDSKVSDQFSIDRVQPHSLCISKFSQTSTNDGGINVRSPLETSIHNITSCVSTQLPLISDGEHDRLNYVQGMQHKTTFSPTYSPYGQRSIQDVHFTLNKTPSGLKLPEVQSTGILKQTQLEENRIGFDNTIVRPSIQRQMTKRVSFVTENNFS